MEIYQIVNEQFEVSITAIGAEICSFKSKKTGKEFMWQGNPQIWRSHAPVLFPIVGGLKNNQFTYKGKSYSMPRHGFIRKNEDLQIVEKYSHKITLELQSNSKIREQYPFEFIFQISFAIENNKLTITHHIFNTDQKRLYFSLGAHPAFNCPWNEDEIYEDYFLEFDQTEYSITWNLNTSGLIASEGDVVMNNSQKLPLHRDLFQKDALIFKTLKSRKVSLVNSNTHEKINVYFDHFNSLGLWAKPGAPFVCIEPWLGYADAENHDSQLINKEGILTLESGKDFSASYFIEIDD